MEGLRKIGPHIPQPGTAQEAPISTPITGMFLTPSVMQSLVWCLFPPLSPSEALIFMWGWGLQQEVVVVLRFHSPPSHLPNEL